MPLLSALIAKVSQIGGPDNIGEAEENMWLLSAVLDKEHSSPHPVSSPSGSFGIGLSCPAPGWRGATLSLVCVLGFLLKTDLPPCSVTFTSGTCHRC